MNDEGHRACLPRLREEEKRPEKAGERGRRQRVKHESNNERAYEARPGKNHVTSEGGIDVSSYIAGEKRKTPKCKHKAPHPLRKGRHLRASFREGKEYWRSRGEERSSIQEEEIVPTNGARWRAKGPSETSQRKGKSLRRKAITREKSCNEYAETIERPWVEEKA